MTGNRGEDTVYLSAIFYMPRCINAVAAKALGTGESLAICDTACGKTNNSADVGFTRRCTVLWRPSGLDFEATNFSAEATNFSTLPVHSLKLARDAFILHNNAYAIAIFFACVHEHARKRKGTICRILVSHQELSLKFVRAGAHYHYTIIRQPQKVRLWTRDVTPAPCKNGS